MSGLRPPERPRSAADLLAQLEMWGQKLGLDRIEDLLGRLDSPQLATPTVLVAGTNGKGSTVALLASILRSAGYRDGAFFSPHLESVRERIRIEGRALEEAELHAHLEHLLEVCRDETPTYFEALAASAFLAFRQRPVDLGVLEVGLGGRLDATNVADPVLSAITSIGFDHEEHLGPTLTAIAGEKAGILRRGRPAVVHSGGQEEVATALRAAARRAGAELEDVAETMCVEVLHTGRAGSQVLLQGPEGQLELDTRLVGRHQLRNLCVAVRSAQMLRHAGWRGVDEEAIQRGVERVEWPGRLEWVELPFADVLLDGAHNPAGALALAEVLDSLQQPVVMLYASVRRKRLDEVLQTLLPGAAAAVLTEPDAGHRSLPVAELHEMAASVGESASAAKIELHAEPDWRRAFEAAVERCRQEPSGDPARRPVLLICGSLYLVGAVRSLLNHRWGRPDRAVDLVL